MAEIKMPSTEGESTQNLIEGLFAEMNRVRLIIKVYEETPAGNFAASLMKISIKECEKAIANGDVVAMVKSYQDLTDYNL